MTVKLKRKARAKAKAKAKPKLRPARVFIRPKATEVPTPLNKVLGTLAYCIKGAPAELGKVEPIGLAASALLRWVQAMKKQLAEVEVLLEKQWNETKE